MTILLRALIQPAANKVTLLDFHEFRLDFCTDRAGIFETRLAARRKPAASRQVDQIGNRTWDDV